MASNTENITALERVFATDPTASRLLGWLDPSSLAHAALVCKKWRERAIAHRDGDKFRLVLADLLARPQILEWWMAKKNPPMPLGLELRASIIAVNHDCLPGLQWLIMQKHYIWNGSAFCLAAVKHGSLAVLKWVYETDGQLQLTEWLCAMAAENNRLEVLQWLRKNGCPWDFRTCNFAAKNGHLDVLVWARSQNPPCPWNEKACTSAAENAHFDVLQWLHANGCPWDKHTCGGAAKAGHLEMLQWARANGCPWNKDVGVYASAKGHLGLLQWACAHGCPWNKDLYLHFAEDNEMKAWISARPA